MTADRALLQEHPRRCGELDSGVESLRARMTCSCGPGITEHISEVALPDPKSS